LLCHGHGSREEKSNGKKKKRESEGFGGRGTEEEIKNKVGKERKGERGDEYLR
jgi:hypothetical protein